MSTKKSTKSTKSAKSAKSAPTPTPVPEQDMAKLDPGATEPPALDAASSQANQGEPSPAVLEGSNDQTSATSDVGGSDQVAATQCDNPGTCVVCGATLAGLLISYRNKDGGECCSKSCRDASDESIIERIKAAAKADDEALAALADIPPAVFEAMKRDAEARAAEKVQRKLGKKPKTSTPREPKPSRWPATFKGVELPNPRTASAPELEALYQLLTGKTCKPGTSKATTVSRLSRLIAGRPVNRTPLALHGSQLDKALDLLKGAGQVFADRETLIICAVNALLQSMCLDNVMADLRE
jgi:hypothetical protein